jgi:hypothetical protein
MLVRRGAGTALAAAVLVAAWIVACDGSGQPEVHHGGGGSGGAGGSSGSAGTADGGDGDGSVTDAGDAAQGDAPLAPVRLGILPVPRPGDAGATPGDVTAALLEVVSIGSRGVTLSRRWDALYSSATEPVNGEWSKLVDVASLFHDSGGVLVSLDVVDRTLDARPPGVGGAWNGSATRTAIETLVDHVFSTFGEELYAVSFGDEIDRWLEQANAADRADMVAFLEHAVSYAQGHPSRPAATVVGVDLRADAIVAGSPPEVESLTALGDVVVVSYVPLDSSFHVRPASAVASDLDALSSALTADAGDTGAPRPVLIQELGYPSAPDCGSSVDLQQAFYDATFQALAARRERFPFLVVNGLYGADPQGCATDAAALGVPGNATAIAALCSLGLRDATGTTKPAYSSLLDALATFATP